MGCDIHIEVQAYDPATDSWWNTGYAAYNDRNYALFGMLAGVRNYTTPPFHAPRGWPPGCLEELGPEWTRDLHTPTWYTLQELLEAPWKKPYPDTYYGKTYRQAAGSFTIWLDYIRKLAKYHRQKPEHVRVIIAFDS